MKRQLLTLLTLFVSAFVFTSCGDDEPEIKPSGSVTESIVQRSCSIKEGETVDASSVSTITIAYNTLVKINPSAAIKLNDQLVKAVSSAATKMQIEIAVSLAPGTAYTLTIPSGTVFAENDETKTAPAFTLNFTTKKTGEQSLPDNEAMAVTRMLGFGWNLGNHFDSHNNGQPVPESWGSWWDRATPTEALYQNLSKAGVKTVRIPVTWGPWEGDAPEYPIAAEYMALVKQNVLWAKSAGLKVVLNTHHDEYWQDAFAASGTSAVNDELKQRITATWTQIAEAFKNEGDYLILETFNELNHNWQGATAGELTIMNEWNQVAVDAIRATGGQNATRWIAVPSYQASPSLALDSRFQIPSDAANKLIVAIHCYDPYDFTLAEKLSTTWGSEGDKKAITNLLSQVKEKFIDQNIPCYLGEFGCSRHETEQENLIRDYYLEYFCRAAHFAGLSACLWDNFNPGSGSEHHAFFSHNDGSWMDGHEAIVKTMIKALTSSDENYTLESIKSTK